MRGFLSLLGVLLASSAIAQTGPGLGNRAYSAAELLSPIGFIESPEGHGNVTMVQGYLMTIYSSDGGGTGPTAASSSGTSRTPPRPAS